MTWEPVSVSTSSRKGTKPNLWIFMKPGKLADSGKRLKLTGIWRIRGFLHCNIKTPLNLLSTSWLQRKRSPSDDAANVYYHRGDIVTECAHSNVSIIKDGVFKDPPDRPLYFTGNHKNAHHPDLQG